MKVLYDYTPLNTSDVSLTMTSSSMAMSNFPLSNLKNIDPSKSFKFSNVGGSTIYYITYDAGLGKTFNINSLFLNRFNFANFSIQGSTNLVTFPYDLEITGCVRDELYDPNNSLITSDNYMSYFAVLTAFNYRYLRLKVPAQTPLFETTYFKIGNMLIGNSVEIWNPKNGMSVTVVPNTNITEFDSGYDSYYKKGKSYRIFEGEFNNISKTEYDKIRYALNPFVLYTDWTGNPQDAYLMRNIREFRKTYEMATILTKQFSFKEVV
jgi:hypothetical protein